VEDALERLARLNMEFNEAATCPAERQSLERRRQMDVPGVQTVLAHSHDRCVPYSTRLIFQMCDDDGDDEFYEYASDGQQESCAVYEVKQGRSAARRRGKSVEFARDERPKVFRYPSEALIEAYYGGAEEVEEEVEAEEEDEDDNDMQETEESEGRDERWWWAGWEEQQSQNMVREWSL